MNHSGLSNLTKSVLLRRIRKYEKTSGNKSQISMKNKKQDMIDYLNEHKPSKGVKFGSIKVVEIKGRTEAERKKRRGEIKKIKTQIKKLKKLRSIYYKVIPTLKTYLDIKKHNTEMKLKKREPLDFVKGLDFLTGKRTIYEQIQGRKYKMEYQIYANKGKVKLKIYDNKDPKNLKKIEKKYKYDKKDKYDKYRAEYLAKVELIKYIRKVLKKN